MNKKKRSILIASILIVVICIVGLLYIREPTAYEVRDNAINALMAVKTYSFDTNLEMKDEESEMKITMGGDVDLENKKMHTSMVIGGDTMEMPSDMYVTDNVVYLNIFGRWAKQNIISGSFYKEDQLKNQIELLKDADVTYFGTNSVDKPYTEEVDGEDCYVLDVRPSTIKVLNYVEGQIREPGGLIESEKPEKRIKSISMREWIAKSDMLPRKIIINGEVEEIGGKTEIHVTMKLYGYNENLNIELPEGAKNAKEISEMSEE